MRKIILVAALLSLTGCTTLERVGKRACENFHTVSAGLALMYANSANIEDPTVRFATQQAIRAVQDAMATCPPSTVQVQ